MTEIITPKRNLEESLIDTLVWCSRPGVIAAKNKLEKKRFKKTVEVSKGQLYKIYRSKALFPYTQQVVEAYGKTNEREIAFDKFLAQRKDAIKSVPALDTTFYATAAKRQLERPKSLLLSAFDETVEDGASGYLSYGFVDWHDAPPVDTWVDISTGTSGTKYLISWVPEWVQKHVDAAIEVNCVSCLAWAKYSVGKLERIPPE